MTDTIPNEIYPSDAEVGLLDGQVDAATGLAYIAKGTNPSSSPSYEVQYNRRQQRQNRRLAMATEGLVVDEGSLTVGVYPCHYTLAGVRRRFTGATAQAVPDNATRYAYLDSEGALQIAAAYPVDVSNQLPLAKIVTLNGKTTITPEIGYARQSIPVAVWTISETIAAQVGEVIDVTLALTDAGGQAVAQKWMAELWLSDAALDGLTATAPSGGMSITTGTQLGADLVTDKHLKAVADSAGEIVVSITHNDARIYALNVVSTSLPTPQSFSVSFSAS